MTKDMCEDVCCFKYKNGNCQVIEQNLTEKRFKTPNGEYHGVTCTNATDGKLCGWCEVEIL